MREGSSPTLTQETEKPENIVEKDKIADYITDFLNIGDVLIRNNGEEITVVSVEDRSIYFSSDQVKHRVHWGKDSLINDVVEIRPVYGIPGNPELSMEESIPKIRKADPKTGEAYNPELSPKEKRQKIREGIEFARETLVSQYKLLAETATGVYEYLDNKPDTEITDLEQEFLSKDAQKILSPKQADRVRKEMTGAIERIKIVKQYYEQYKDNPQALLEEVLGLTPGSLTGEVEFVETQGVLHFNIKDPKDFKIAYQDEDPDSIAGFATQRSNIPELRGAITVSNEAKTSSLEDTIAHEQRHQINKFCFSENDNREPLVMAKDEILAYFTEDTDPGHIKKVLTKKNDSYDYHPQFSEDSNEWQKYITDVKFYVDLADKMRKSDGKVDINLLSVTPIEHWKMLFKEANPKSGLPEKQTPKRNYEDITEESEVKEAIHNLIPGDVLSGYRARGEYEVTVTVVEVNGDDITLRFDNGQQQKITKTFLSTNLSSAEPLYPKVKKCQSELISRRIAFEHQLDNLKPSDVLSAPDGLRATILSVDGENIKYRWPGGNEFDTTKNILVASLTTEDPYFDSVIKSNHEVIIDPDEFERHIDDLMAGDQIILKGGMTINILSVDGDQVTMELSDGRLIDSSKDIIRKEMDSFGEIRKDPKPRKYQIIANPNLALHANNLAEGDVLVLTDGRELTTFKIDDDGKITFLTDNGMTVESTRDKLREKPDRFIKIKKKK